MVLVVTFVSALVALASPANQLDAANRCKLLPAVPRTATILHDHRVAPPLAEGDVQLRLAHGSRAVVAGGVEALGHECRALVAELGEVDAIHTTHANPLTLMRLRAAYGAPVENCSPADSPADSPGDDAVALARGSESCEVVFAKRGPRRRVSELLAACARTAARVPLLGGAMGAASALAARVGVAQLTPTYRPTVSLRVLKKLPWRLQRLGVRVWLQSMLRDEQSLPIGGEGVDGGKDGGIVHPMAVVRTMPMLSVAECEDAIAESEAYAASIGGWLTDRHVSYPTTDIEISNLPRLKALWEARVFPNLSDEFSRALSLPAGSTVNAFDVFVVKYDAAGGQKELAVHRDNGLLTFSMLLSDPTDFGGGGTYFEAAGRVYRPSRGVGVLHSALVRHAGYPITSGTRYVLVGFCGLASPKLPENFDNWRFGSPPWFVSSRVVSDEQLLGRIWPRVGRAVPAEAGGGGVGGGGNGGVRDEALATGQAVAVAEEEEEEDYDSYPSEEELVASGDMSEKELGALEAEMAQNYEAYPSEEELGISDENFDAYPSEEELGISEENFDSYPSEDELSMPEAEAMANGRVTPTADETVKPHAAAGSDVAAVPGQEKPWYRAQHELAARARSEGVLLTRHDDVQFDEKTGEACALTFEMWRSGEDYVALLVAPEESEEAVVASTTFRDGPVPPDMRRLLRARLPAPSLSRKVRGLLQRKSLAGMVHVYTAPKWRGGGHGEALSRFAMHALRKEAGFTHALTLADDRGSGKLREWYGRLGFVGAHELGDTAMVARTDATRRK